MLDRQRILGALRRVARTLGRAPALLEFVRLAGISKYAVMKCFPRWNEAVQAAGLQPRRLKVCPSDEELLKDWGETVRQQQDVPSRSSHRRIGKYYPRTLERRFGGWPGVPRAFGDFAKDKAEWADVRALVAARQARERAAARRKLAPVLGAGEMQHAPRRDRPVCGNPIDFRGLRHEPTNEQGVVLLFGMLAKDLGYLVENVQKEFPDCEAKRRVGPGKWQNVRIEFEFESKNFREHGHPAKGCDVIVCWRHNWKECPEHLEILELSTVIKPAAKSELPR